MSENESLNNPFKRVAAFPEPGSDSCRVEWEVVSDFTDLQDCADFIIRRSPDPGYSNVEIVKSGITFKKDTFTGKYVDTTALVGNRETTWYYQVILRYSGRAIMSAWVSAKGRDPLGSALDATDPYQDKIKAELGVDECIPIDITRDTVQTEETSIEGQADDFATRQQLGIARQIMKLERAHMNRAGSYVGILKRNLSGTACKVCRDEDTGQIKNSLCTNCYGTGVVGGYEEEICIYLENITPRSETVTPKPRGEGQDDPVRYVFRHASAPEIKQYDVIVTIHDNLRFVVEKVDKFQFKGKQPLLSHITVSQVHSEHILYKVPVTCEKKITIPEIGSGLDTPEEEIEPTPTPSSSSTPEPTPSATSTPTPSSSSAPKPTPTPSSSSTPEPTPTTTSTPEPTPEPTSTPTPSNNLGVVYTQCEEEVIYSKQVTEHKDTIIVKGIVGATGAKDAYNGEYYFDPMCTAHKPHENTFYSCYRHANGSFIQFSEEINLWEILSPIGIPIFSSNDVKALAPQDVNISSWANVGVIGIAGTPIINS